ncbi:MAG: hypothetical protein GF411_01500 [Candidatus Lokiarchaeota archaeon]|nr:hypothetical protein [Candidatus Lokiarchaeota archaeon]
MSQDSQSLPEYLPNLVIFSVLLVVEYWAYVTHLGNLAFSGDYGPLVGIPMIIGLVIMLFVILGLYSISKSSEMHKKLLPIALILLLVQMVLMLFEYLIPAIEA